MYLYLYRCSRLYSTPLSQAHRGCSLDIWATSCVSLYRTPNRASSHGDTFPLLLSAVGPPHGDITLCVGLRSMDTLPAVVPPLAVSPRNPFGSAVITAPYYSALLVIFSHVADAIIHPRTDLLTAL